MCAAESVGLGLGLAAGAVPDVVAAQALATRASATAAAAASSARPGRRLGPAGRRRLVSRVIIIIVWSRFAVTVAHACLGA